ncbi:hypothetical protein HYALB_00007157 [Hymenoscyphus albidus]|uniref:Uncharacterized protein n=1 Tax=Hymenoscyphus albidus TaxID=595503 RepID=A0A9N9PRG4_9HELO|nr:hypothetical protein HYALB_00007157 [Hymenoscyphus albidus]
MRCRYLGLMASFWVLSPVHGQEDSSQLKAPFTTNVQSFAPNTTGISPYTGNPTTTYTISFKTSNANHKNTTLFLCQATAPDGVTTKLPISTQRLGSYCAGNVCHEEKSLKDLNGIIENDQERNILFTLEDGTPPPGYFFLCFTNDEQFCASTSKAFQILGSSTAPGLPGEPEQLISGLQFNPFIHQSDTSPRYVRPDGGLLPSQTSTQFATTTIIPPTQTPTSDASSTQDTTTTPAPPSGLSTAAKAGIGVGALGVAAIILLGILLCLRKRQRQTKGPDQIMLNQSSADSHDLITEKEAERSSPSSYEAPTQVYSGALNLPPKPQTPTRHSALSPYEEIPSQPYTGSAAAIPRRKPTLSSNKNANPTNINNPTPPIADPSSSSPPSTTTALSPTTTVSPTISREVSAASTIGPPSRNDVSPPARSFEEYRDVPTTYAERHTPPAPFLGNERKSRGSMSEADLVRLTEEEEERRIDAAIEEAERLKSVKGR